MLKCTHNLRETIEMASPLLISERVSQRSSKGDGLAVSFSTAHEPRLCSFSRHHYHRSIVIPALLSVNLDQPTDQQAPVQSTTFLSFYVLDLLYGSPNAAPVPSRLSNDEDSWTRFKFIIYSQLARMVTSLGQSDRLGDRYSRPVSPALKSPVL